MQIANKVSSSSPRVALVTGGTDGIGRAVALALARAGDRVLFVGRDLRRGQATLTELRGLAPHQEHRFIPADLSLLSEAARAAREVAVAAERLDALVCCAGILSTRPEQTTERLERNLVLNYLSRYLLVRALLPQLERSDAGRVVLVANPGKYPDTLDLDDLQHTHGRPGLHVAGRTQIANDLFCTELVMRLPAHVRASCVFPGMLVQTAVLDNARGLPRAAVWLMRIVQRWFGRTPEQGAATAVALARASSTLPADLRFYGPELRALPVPERSENPTRRRMLWDTSELLVRPYQNETAERRSLSA